SQYQSFAVRSSNSRTKQCPAKKSFSLARPAKTATTSPTRTSVSTPSASSGRSTAPAATATSSTRKRSRCASIPRAWEPEMASVEVVERRSFPGRVTQFYHEVQDEMRKVTWPDRAQLKDTTIKIIIFVLFIGAVIGAIDLILQLIFVQGIPSLFSRR